MGGYTDGYSGWYPHQRYSIGVAVSCGASQLDLGRRKEGGTGDVRTEGKWVGCAVYRSGWKPKQGAGIGVSRGNRWKWLV